MKKITFYALASYIFTYGYSKRKDPIDKRIEDSKDKSANISAVYKQIKNKREKGIEYQHVSNALNELSSLGLVDFGRVGHDKRYSITEKGWEVLKKEVEKDKTKYI